jgi:signal peptidase I
MEGTDSQTKLSSTSSGSSRSFFTDLVRFALITLAIVLPIRLFIAEPFIVNGASMEPTFETGDYLIVDRISYQFEAPKRGEVVIFRYPRNPDKYFIKRIVGLPGETIILEGDKTTIKNTEHPEGFTLDETFIVDRGVNHTERTLAADEYFVMGDNRTESSDSRSWGPLQKSYLIGRAYLRLFPPVQFGVFPGAKVEQYSKAY